MSWGSDGVWLICSGVCVLSGGCLEGVWGASGGCLGVSWRCQGCLVVSGGCQVVSWWCFRHFFRSGHFRPPPPLGHTGIQDPGSDRVKDMDMKNHCLGPQETCNFCY